VAPIWSVADVGVTVTDATGRREVAVTASGALPVFPPLEAEIMVEPTASAVTIPESVNVAALALLELHTTAGPVTTLLLESRSVAVARSVWPTASELAARLTVTEATLTVERTTVRVAAALLYPRVAIMETVPGDLAVTSPDPETVANEGSLVLQTTGSDSGLL
jgi:hypothetical protein